MIRYFIQLGAMLSDIAIIAACCVLICSLPSLGPMGAIIGIFLLFKTYQTWKSQGGFIAWKPYWIKRFMKNMKEIGL